MGVADDVGERAGLSAGTGRAGELDAVSADSVGFAGLVVVADGRAAAPVGAMLGVVAGRRPAAGMAVPQRHRDQRPHPGPPLHPVQGAAEPGPERGGGRRVVGHLPVDDSERLEPDDPDDARMRGQLPEHLGNPVRHQPADVRCPCLGDDKGLASKSSQLSDCLGECRVEGFIEQRAWRPVVAGQPDPVNIAIARIQFRQVGGVVPDDVRRPYPDYVLRADPGEDIVHMPPCPDVLADAITVGEDAPRVPEAVHLVRETDRDRVRQALYALGP